MLGVVGQIALIPPPTGSQLKQHTAKRRRSDWTDPAAVLRCVCMYSCCAAYRWGRGHMQSLGRTQLQGQLLHLLQTFIWHLRVIDEGCSIFGRGDARVLFHRMFCFSRGGFILAGLLLRSAALSSLLSSSLSISVLSSSPSFISLWGAVSSLQPPLRLINFGDFV